MASVPSWIQKENEVKAMAEQAAEAAAKRSADAATFFEQHSPRFWDQLATAIGTNANALEMLAGEELHGSMSKSVTGTENNIYVRVERRSVTHGPAFAWMNLWYIPGNGSMRWYYMDQMKPNIELAVVSRPGRGKDILATFAGTKLDADQLGESIVRQMREQVRPRQRR